MSGKAIILCTTLMLFSSFSKDSVQAQTRTTQPNDVGLELFGKGLLGSLSYQRMITPFLGLQVGLLPVSDDDSSAICWGFSGHCLPAPAIAYVVKDEEVLITLEGKLYLRPGNASPFAAGGIVLNRTSLEESGPIQTETFPYIGLGYEVRRSGGFFWRATLYALFFNEELVLRNNDSDWRLPMAGSVSVWPGLYVGYAF